MKPLDPDPDPEDPWIRIRNAAYRYYRYCITIETWGICFSGGRIWFLFIPACSTLTAVNICLKNTSGSRSPVISAPPAPQHWIGVLNVYKIAKKTTTFEPWRLLCLFPSSEPCRSLRIMWRSALAGNRRVQRAAVLRTTPWIWPSPTLT